MPIEIITQLANAIGGIFVVVGGLFIVFGRPGAGFTTMLISGLLAVVVPAIAIAMPEMQSYAYATWANWPAPWRYLTVVAGVLLGILFAILVAGAVLRLVARPFIGRAAADVMVARLSGDAIHFVFGGFLIRLYRLLMRMFLPR